MIAGQGGTVTIVANWVNVSIAEGIVLSAP